MSLIKKSSLPDEKISSICCNLKFTFLFNSLAQIRRFTILFLNKFLAASSNLDVEQKKEEKRRWLHVTSFVAVAIFLVCFIKCSVGVAIQIFFIGKKSEKYIFSFIIILSYIREKVLSSSDH